MAELTPDRLTVVIEALREYRLRVDLVRRVVIDNLILELLGELKQIVNQ